MPALLLRHDGGLEKLESTSTVMGMFEHWDSMLEERQLNPGDTLLLYTDGVTEASNHEEEEFGEERLVETLRQHRDLVLKELIEAIAGRVRRFSPNEQADDITLIVAKCS
jgi:serine phosphatase RsbU (regulator of sigma subunit)